MFLFSCRSYFVRRRLGFNSLLLKTRVCGLSGLLGGHLLRTGAWVLTAFGTLLRGRAPFVVALSMGFNTWTTELAGKCMGFKRHYLTTRANASNKHVNGPKICVNSSRVSPSESKWVQ